MRNNIRTRAATAWSPIPQHHGIRDVVKKHIVGQDHSIEDIVPYIEMHQAGLAPENRPVGVFLLLGPTGTGKTRLCESIAAALHGSEKSMVRIDCGEFQMEHEVAKLIGAPPGYLGHRETQPMLTQAKLNAATSENSNLSIVLLDEIEKAAGSMGRLLLGVLDKAALRLGDNNTVNFDKSLIFMTSNLGAEQMSRELKPWFGLEAHVHHQKEEVTVEAKLKRIGLAAVKKKFSPEFVNRIDSVVTFHPLGNEEFAQILEIQLQDLQHHIIRRMGTRAFRLQFTSDAKKSLLSRGVSAQYGARELKRVILREVTQPLAVLVLKGSIPAGSIVKVSMRDDKIVFGTETES